MLIVDADQSDKVRQCNIVYEVEQPAQKYAWSLRLVSIDLLSVCIYTSLYEAPVCPAVQGKIKKHMCITCQQHLTTETNAVFNHCSTSSQPLGKRITGMNKELERL